MGRKNRWRPLRRHNENGRVKRGAPPALRVGDEFVGTVRDIHASGVAVVPHGSGKVVFVRGLWLGEEASLMVTKVGSRFVEARVLDILRQSHSRVVAPCPWYSTEPTGCGGCAWQFIDYTEQLRAKQRRVQKAFERFNVEDALKMIIASEKHFGYRNRAQLKTDGRTLGLVANDQCTIVDVDVCVVLENDVQSIMDRLRRSLPNPDWQPPHKQRWTTVDIDAHLGEERTSINRRLPFRQANSRQNDVIHSWLREKLFALPKDRKLVELFCGSGNLTQTISSAGFTQIVAVEAVSDALSGLNQLALPGVVTEKRNLFDESAFENFWSRHRDTDVLVLDPPRDGLKVKTGLMSKKSKLKNVIYISCDLATLVRDVGYFYEQGFLLTEIQPLDMFPQTPHLEVMVCLQRR